VHQVGKQNYIITKMHGQQYVKNRVLELDTVSLGLQIKTSVTKNTKAQYQQLIQSSINKKQQQNTNIYL